MSAQSVPLPEKPALQEHVTGEVVSSHKALTSQLSHVKTGTAVTKRKLQNETDIDATSRKK